MKLSCRKTLICCAATAVAVAGCSKEPPPSASAVKPREAPSFTQSNAPASQPVSTGAATEGGAALPPGHPAIGANDMGHAGAMSPAATDAGEASLQIKMPAEFQPKPARMMTLQVYAAPKLQADPEDADVAVSALGAKVPFKMNLDRWCGMFELPAGKTCENGIKQETLEGTKYPTTLVEIAGTYKGSSMMGSQSAPKPDYEMVAAEIVTADKPYYVKMVGPAKTVEHWKPALVEAIKAAK